MTSSKVCNLNFTKLVILYGDLGNSIILAKLVAQQKTWTILQDSLAHRPSLRFFEMRLQDQDQKQDRLMIVLHHQRLVHLDLQVLSILLQVVIMIEVVHTCLDINYRRSLLSKLSDKENAGKLSTY